MHFNPLHQSMITKNGNIKRSYHSVNMIKLTPVSREMTPVVINFSIKGGRCDSHANRAEWQGGHDNFSKLRQPNCRGGATGNHIIRLRGGGGALFIKIKQHGLHCLSLHHQHICRYDRFHCGYAFTYSNELLKNSFQISQVSY